MKLLWASSLITAVSICVAAPLTKGPGTGALQSATVITAERDGERLSPIGADEAGTLHVAEDGTRFLLLRFRSPGAQALRLRISDMRLPEGARLFVYGLGANEQDIAGPYEGSGPGIDADFWTDAVAGSEVVVELQMDSTTPADLPFEVTELAWSEPASKSIADHGHREIRTSYYRGMVLTHEVNDGLAILERDIILGPVEELVPADAKSKSSRRDSVTITGARYRWPGGVIPYAIDATAPNPTWIAAAIAQWNAALTGHVKLIPRTTQANYVAFQRASSSGTCSSSVGMTGMGRQAVSIGSSCSQGNITHEIGHAIGLWHEQSREDRDRFVKVLWANIPTAQKYNFSLNSSTGDDRGSYDYNSIMHYNAYAFSLNGMPTIETVPAGIPIGQRTCISAGDIAGVKALYPLQAGASGSTTPAPAPVTSADYVVTTNPVGLPITVDGATYTSPKTFNWIIGSTHSIAAGAPTPTTTKHTFQRWSDGGAQSHTVTAQLTATTFKADYSVSYAVRPSAVQPGTATVSPASADGFYATNSVVTLTAGVPTGYCFSGWSGLLAGTPSSTTLQVTKAYNTIQAGVLPGSITVGATAVTAPAAGGDVQVGITANTGCLWTSTSLASWVRVMSGASGSGSGVVVLKVDANTAINSRSATLIIAGRSVTVTQPGL